VVKKLIGTRATLNHQTLSDGQGDWRSHANQRQLVPSSHFLVNAVVGVCQGSGKLPEASFGL